MLLELLDLIVEPKTRKLIPNPASPEMPMMETAYNSRYAVRCRSPKPLRASHTRKALYEIPNPAFKKGIFQFVKVRTAHNTTDWNVLFYNRNSSF